MPGAWRRGLQGKAALWNELRDSLQKPFGQARLADTIFLWAGLHGNDDGFTFGGNILCLDLTALRRNFGRASQQVNKERIDRIFAHEYTHLLHKAWATEHGLQLRNFRDSVLWECLYEGMGMFRSLSPRWLPLKGQLPDTTVHTMTNLIPLFVEHIGAVGSERDLPEDKKASIFRNLSRGSVPQKWGALPVAIWLSLEAAQDERRLQFWIDKGPEGIIELARKYLPPAYARQLR